MSMLRWLVRAFGLQALAGIALWLVVAGIALAVDEPALELPAVLLLFAQLVVVPVGLRELRPGGGAVATALVHGAWFAWRPAAVAAIAALAIPPGELSAAVAAVTLLPALAVGLAALVSLPAVLRDPTRCGHGAAAAFLLVGSLFFVLHRQGGSWAGVDATIVQLTAVHFHVAGFGLALVAAALGERRRRIGAVAVWSLVLGMGVTAVGFLTVPAVQIVGAVLVVAALMTVSVGTVAVHAAIRPSAAAWVLRASAACGVAVSALALVYATTEATGTPVIDIPTMAATHGVLAAVGVVGAGLVGWRLAER
jgi:hypothetical protein